MSIAGEAAVASKPASDPNPRRTSLGALAISGASALRLLLQLLLLPILARLVGPSEYGLVALAMPFILLANVLADGGLAVALGRRPEASATLESSAFWLAAAVGTSLALLSGLSALPIGHMLHQPRLAPLIAALSPILLMNSLSAVSNGRIIRERRFAVFAAGDLISTVAAAAVALAAALNGWGAWSLVAQQLVLWVIKLAWVSLRAGAQIRLLYSFQELRSVARFGANTLGATFADFISRNVDNMIVGGVLGATALGYYAMGYQIVRIPDMLISGPFYFYILTALSRTSHAGDRSAVQELAKAGLRLGSAALAPLFCGLALLADLAVGAVLGPKWLGAISALRWLSGAGLCFCLCSLIGAMFMGLGRSGLQLRLSMLLGATTVVTVGLSASFGVGAVSAALAGGMGLVLLVHIHLLARDLRMRHRDLLAALAPAAAGCAVMIGVVAPARQALDGQPAAIALAALIVLGAAAYLTVLWLLARRTLLQDARAFSRAHADQRPTPTAADLLNETG